jgi:hypothetical protein
VHEHFSNIGTCVEPLGRRFLAVHFPGIEDPDVTEEINHDRALAIIEDRYVCQ